LEWMIYLHLWNPCHLIFWSYFEQSKANLDRVHNHAITFSHSYCCLWCYLFSQFSGLLRSILGNLGAPRHVRLLAYAKSAIYVFAKKKCHIWPRGTFQIRVWYVSVNFICFSKVAELVSATANILIDLIFQFP
jgi:hypothetical protein